MTTPLITLNSGHKIPQLGYGTYKVTGDDATRCVKAAIEIGYRHIDTAQMYGNEVEVGAAIKASGIDREEIFLTTKLDNQNHRPADVRESFAKSLQYLGVDYVDLFLIHWPLAMDYDNDVTTPFKVMEEFVADGRCRSIGVSNFEPHHLVEILDDCDIVPAVNQVELHPYFSDYAPVKFCQENNILVESWSPLGRGPVVQDPVIGQIAERIGCTPGQVIVAWHLAKGYVVIPKSVTESRIRENFEATEIELSAADIHLIDRLDKGELGRTGRHPDTMLKWGETTRSM